MYRGPKLRMTANFWEHNVSPKTMEKHCNILRENAIIQEKLPWKDEGGK
jgi:hypothetical protein